MWREAQFEVKRRKKDIMLGALCKLGNVKKCTPLRCQHHSQVQSTKRLTVSGDFLKVGCGLAWQAQWIPHLANSQQKQRHAGVGR